MAEISEATEKKTSRRKEAEAPEAPQIEKLVTVVIPSTETEDYPQFVSVNQRTWAIPRDTEVQIPECAYLVLQRSAEKKRDAIAFARKTRSVQ